MKRPPCWPDGQPCPNGCAAALHDRIAHNQTTLFGPWAGWRMAGRDLVAPDGDRISPERLRGLLWRQAAEARVAAARCRREKRVGRRTITVVRIANDDWHRERFGSIAG